MYVFLCTILVGDDRNDACMSVFMCSILAGKDRNKMSACVYFSAQYLLATTEVICLHVCIYVYNTCC